MLHNTFFNHKYKYVGFSYLSLDILEEMPLKMRSITEHSTLQTSTPEIIAKEMLDIIFWTKTDLKALSISNLMLQSSLILITIFLVYPYAEMKYVVAISYLNVHHPTKLL
jgi:hypothetical protein